MKPVINRYGAQLMPHSIPMDQPKECVVVSNALVMEILEEVFQIITLNVSKVLNNIHELITSKTN